MRPRFVVFDFDGVLVDTIRLWYGIVTDELRACGIDVALEEVLSAHRGRLLQHVQADIEREHSIRLPDGWIERAVARAEVEIGRSCQPIPGSVDAARSLHGRGLPLAVASGSLRNAVADGVLRIGLADLLGDRIVSSHDDGRHKPLPDVYLRACRLLEMDPGSGLAVEDSATGVISAKAAGMTVVGLAVDSDPEPLFRAGASVVLERMDDLPGLIG